MNSEYILTLDFPKLLLMQCRALCFHKGFEADYSKHTNLLNEILTSSSTL